MRRALWASGARYRKNVAALIGNPDVVFIGARVAVFCDGDFWHGRNWADLRAKLLARANPEYWVAKIESNVQRDLAVTAQLEERGWAVIRLWETDILRDAQSAAEHVMSVVAVRRDTRRGLGN